MAELTSIEQELQDLVRPINKQVLNKDVETFYGQDSGNSTNSDIPEIRMKVEGEYVFFVCPPTVDFTPETPYGGRIGLVVKTHWNLPKKDGKTNGVILDAEGSFPWLGVQNPLKRVIEKWEAKGFADNVKENVSSESAYFNVLLVDSPDPDHAKYLQTVENGKLVNKVTVSILESNVVTLKFLQEQINNKFAKFDLTHPLKGSLVSIKKVKKAISGGTRVGYERSIVPHSPMWYEGLPHSEQVAAIKEAIAGSHNLFEQYRPNKYYESNIREYAETLDAILENQFKYVESSNSLSRERAAEFNTMPKQPVVQPQPIVPQAPAPTQAPIPAPTQAPIPAPQPLQPGAAQPFIPENSGNNGIPPLPFGF